MGISWVDWGDMGGLCLGLGGLGPWRRQFLASVAHTSNQ